MSELDVKTSPTPDNRSRISAAAGAGLFGIFAVCFILAVTSYSATQSFIKNLIEEKYSKIAQNNVEILTRELADIESALATVEQTVLTSDAVIDFPHFDQILLAWSSGSQAWQYKPIQVHENTPDKQKLYEIQDYKSLQPFMEDARAPVNTYLQIFTDPALFISKNQNFRVNHRAYPFALFLKLKPKNGSVLNVIATAHIDDVFSEYWLHDNEIAQISIQDSGSNYEMYEFDSRIDANELLSYAPIYEFSFAGRKWEVKTHFRKQAYIFWLENVPSLLFAFWMLVAALSVLVLRKNQILSSHIGNLSSSLETSNEKLAREITLRESMQKSLTAARHDRKTVIDAVSDIIFETDLAAKILFLNAAWSKITGFDVEQSIGLEFFKIFHPQEQDEIKKDFELMIAGKRTSYRIFTRIRTSDGTFRSVEMSISVIRQDENNNNRIVGTMTDVEERERAEKALREAEKKFRAIVENAASGIYQLTPEGVFLSANPAMARLLGFNTAEELLRNIKNAHESVYTDSKQRQAVLDELETFGALNNFETRIRRRDASYIWVNENVRAVRDEDGNTLYYEGSMEDITQRKEGDIALRDAKMHSDMANRAKSEFLANMSHELRTPLNAIIGFSEIIKDEVFGKIEQASYKDYAKDIYKSGRNLLNIINEILDIAKIESNERQLNDEVVYVSEIVKSSLDLMKNKIASNKLNVANNMRNVPQIIGEEIAIKQIIINILSNAIKFTPARGHITITNELDAQNMLRISITDTGIGLDPHEIQKAISPFGQIDNALNRNNKGTGLGLTLVNSLMKLHGGNVEIVSQKGIGTTVTLIFPASRVVQEDKKQQPQKF